MIATLVYKCPWYMIIDDNFNTIIQESTFIHFCESLKYENDDREENGLFRIEITSIRDDKNNPLTIEDCITQELSPMFEKFIKEIPGLSFDEYENMDDDNTPLESCYLGSLINPSGKYYLPFASSNINDCPNCTAGKLSDNSECLLCLGGYMPYEAMVDDIWKEMLDDSLPEGYWIENGSGDPCDCFLVHRIDNPYDKDFISLRMLQNDKYTLIQLDSDLEYFIEYLGLTEYKDDITGLVLWIEDGDVTEAYITEDSRYYDLNSTYIPLPKYIYNPENDNNQIHLPI